MLYLASQAETFVWGSIESIITSDDSLKKRNKSILKNFDKNWKRQTKYHHKHAELGKPFLPLWLSLVVGSTVITPKI